ncbi:MAG TPA: homoserine O-succinyltransferase [Acidimicrobiia bacterium]|nr:homoserine O-succinyltransferase [Acidimicrobiia bacterium]
MALVVNSSLPAFETMQDEGVTVVVPEDAGGRPSVSVGLLNLMPDAALRATDRQFVRLVSAAADDLDLWVYPFTVAAEHRGEEARRHVDDHYATFDQVASRGVDALIVTGANPAQDRLELETFWGGLGKVLDWAVGETKSVLCSCLATHAVLQKYRGMKRTRLPQKRWGVYSHRVVKDHPLLEGVSSPVEAPHSHWYDVTREEFEAVGLTVVLESDEAGVHMAVDDDDFYVFFQGHPEYDVISLLKEYRRELGRYWRGERAEYPPVPEHYFSDAALTRLTEYRPVLETAKADRRQPPRLDEAELLPKETHTWNDEGKVIYRNWLNRIAQGSV